MPKYLENSVKNICPGNSPSLGVNGGGREHCLICCCIFCSIWLGSGHRRPQRMTHSNFHTDTIQQTLTPCVDACGLIIFLYSFVLLFVVRLHVFFTFCIASLLFWSFCQTWHFPNGALRGITLTLHK